MSVQDKFITQTSKKDTLNESLPFIAYGVSRLFSEFDPIYNLRGWDIEIFAYILTLTGWDFILASSLTSTDVDWYALRGSSTAG